MRVRKVAARRGALALLLLLATALAHRLPVSVREQASGRAVQRLKRHLYA